MHIKYYFIVFLFLTAFNVDGQYEQRRPQNDGISLDETFVDTAGVKYFTLKDLDHLTIVDDPDLTQYEQYAAFRRFETSALTLGNLGSSHYRIKYEPRKTIWRDAGFHQYGIYKIGLEDLKLFKIGQPYNNLSFSPAGSQENFKVGAEFSTNYNDNVNLSINYSRINQAGLYTDQNTKQTALGIGIWRDNPEKGHKFFLTFLANNNNENHNGGVILDTTRTFRERITEPTYLTGADTRHQNFTYSIDNFKSIKDKKYEVHHQFLYENGYIRFSDENTTTLNDSLIYTDMITDSRGLRYFLGFNKFRNTVDVSFNSKGIGLQIGISHQYSRFKDQLKVNNLQEVYAIGKASLTLKNKFQLTIDGKLGLGENVGNLVFDTDLRVSPISGLDISGRIGISRLDPTLLHEELLLTETVIWQNEFSKINNLLLVGQLEYEPLNLNLELRSGIIDNAIAYDTFARPYQSTGSVEYLQASIEHTFRWRFIGTENQFLYQSFSENIYQLPKFYGVHNAFIEFPMFKKNLLTRLGGIYYSMELGEGLNFQPATGVFFPSTSATQNYNYYEAYANFLVKSFRLFLKVENMNDLFIPFEHFQINEYPQNDWRLRVGVNWTFRG